MVLLIKLFMHFHLTEMKILNFIIQLNYINFTDIQEHVENIKMNFVGLDLERFSQQQKDNSCGSFAREYARRN